MSQEEEIALREWLSRNLVIDSVALDWSGFELRVDLRFANDKTAFSSTYISIPRATNDQ